MVTREISQLLQELCERHRCLDEDVLEQTILVGVELAREGREGRKIGTMFVISDAEAVLDQSKCLILDPLYGHPDEVKNITDANMRETVKELALLDGAFVINDQGVVVSACRHINASSKGVNLPLGLGSRHMAAASITLQTDAVAVVVSESSVVRVFESGEIVAEILPEIWLMRRYNLAQGGGDA